MKSKGRSFLPMQIPLLRRNLRFARLCALLCRAFHPRQVERAVDERNVAESLRKIADQPAAARIIFLAQEADIVAHTYQSIKQTARFVPSVLQHIGIDQQKTAGKKRPL